MPSKPCIRTRRSDAVVGPGPPRPPVARAVGRGGPVHVGGDRRHLVLGEDPGDVQEAGLAEEPVHLLVVVVPREAVARRSSGAPAGVLEGHGPRHVGSDPVEGAAQHQPPVEEPLEPARRAPRAPLENQPIGVTWSATRSDSCDGSRRRRMASSRRARTGDDRGPRRRRPRNVQLSPSTSTTRGGSRRTRGGLGQQGRRPRRGRREGRRRRTGRGRPAPARRPPASARPRSWPATVPCPRRRRPRARGVRSVAPEVRARSSSRHTKRSPDQSSPTAATLTSTSPVGSTTSRRRLSVTSLSWPAARRGHTIHRASSGPSTAATFSTTSSRSRGTPHEGDHDLGPRAQRPPDPGALGQVGHRPAPGGAHESHDVAGADPELRASGVPE